jgi:sterol desaturase/sphingolipid hydroxylase (fatty acid hydroxylase superfamily)
LVVVVDFFAYWEHRFEHRFMWPVHMVHHVPTKLHAANSWGHPLQYFPMRLFKYVPLALVDWGGAFIPFAVTAAMQIQAYWVHSQTRVHMGPLRAVFVDNRFHRIHHGLADEYHDKNFGIMFSVWDRLFGTAIEPIEGIVPEVGVQGIEPPGNVFAFLAIPFAQWFKRNSGRYRFGFPRASTPTDL